MALGQGLSFLAIVTIEGRRRAAVELKDEASRNPSYLPHTKSGFQRAAGSPIKAYVQVPPDPSSYTSGFARLSADISPCRAESIPSALGKSRLANYLA